MTTDSGFVFLFIYVLLGGLLAIGSLRVLIFFRQIVEGWIG